MRTLSFCLASALLPTVLVSSAWAQPSESWNICFGENDLTSPEYRYVFGLSSDGGLDEVEVDRSVHTPALNFLGARPLSLLSDGTHAFTADRTDVRTDASVAAGAVAAFGPVAIDAGKTLTVAVDAGSSSDLGIVSVAGPVFNGATRQGGTLRKVGGGELLLTACEGDLLNRVTLEIAEGTLNMQPRLADEANGIPVRDVFLRDFRLVFSGTDDRIWGGRDGYFIHLGGTSEISVAAGQTVTCVSPLCGTGSETPLVKTGAGTLRFRPLHEAFYATVREGVCIVDGSTVKTEVTVAEGGAVASAPDAAEYTGSLIFENGGAVRYRPDAVLKANRITSRGKIAVTGLPDTPTAGLELLESSSVGAEFALPETWKGYSVFYRPDTHRYVIDEAHDVVRTLTGDETWVPETANYGRLELNLGGKTLTVDGNALANEIVLSGAGTLRFAEGASLRTGRVTAEASVTVPAEFIFASAETGETPNVRIAAGQTVTVASDSVAYYNATLSGLRADDGSFLPGGTLLKQGSGQLVLRGAAPRILDGATVAIDGGRLKTVPAAHAVHFRNAGFRFLSGSTVWDYRRGAGDILYSDGGRLRIYVEKGHSVSCDCWQSGGFTKTGGGAYSCCLDRGYESDVREGIWMPEIAGDNNSASDTLVCTGATLASKYDYRNNYSAGWIVLEQDAFVSLKNGPVWANQVKTRGVPTVTDLPAEPEGTVVMRSTAEGLRFALPEDLRADYGVVHEMLPELGLCYVVRRMQDAERPFDTDTVWNESGAFRTLTLKPNGHTVTVAGRVAAGTLVIDGTESAQSGLVLAEGASLSAERIVFRASARVPDTLFLSLTEGGVTPNAEIAQDVTVTVASDRACYYNGTLSGLRAEDGTVSAGGTLLKTGTGLLILRGAQTLILDSVTVAIDGGQLKTVPAGFGVRWRRAGFRFLSGSPVWDYRHGMGDVLFSFDGPLSVYVAEGHRISCDCWQSGGVVKTGRGAYKFCQDRGYTADIREGVWLPESGNDNRAESVTTVRRGATVRNDGGTANGKIVFEDGARLSLANGMLDAPRAETRGTIVLTDLPEQPESGYAVLKSDAAGLRFALPRTPAYAGWAVAPDSGRYVLTRPESVALTGDTVWNTPADYGLLHLNLGGRKLTVNTAVKVGSLMLTALGGTIELGPNGSLTVDAVRVADSVTLPASLLFSEKESDPTPMLEIEPNAEVTVAVEKTLHRSSPIVGLPAEAGERPGKLIKTGTGLMTLLATPGYIADGAAVEIRGGMVRTCQFGGRQPAFRDAELRFCEPGRADQTWQHYPAKIQAEDLTVYVGANQKVFCDAWLYGHYIKTGPGELACSPAENCRITMTGGICRPVSSTSSSVAEVKRGGCIGYYKGNYGKSAGGPFLGTVSLEHGACVDYTDGAPEFSGKVTVPEKAQLRISGPVPQKGAVCILKTEREGLAFRHGVPGFGVEYTAGRYMLSMSETMTLTEDLTLSQETEYGTLKLDLAGHTLTFDAPVNIGKLEISDSGDVPGKLLVGEKGSVTASAVWAKTSMELPRQLLCPEGMFVSDLLIAPDTEVRLDVPEATESVRRGILTTYPLPTAGQKRGRLVKTGTGRLKMYGATPRLMDEVVLEIRQGSLYTPVGSRNVELRNSELCFSGPAGDMTWFHHSGTIYLYNAEIRVATPGLTVFSNAWIEGGLLRKTGPGALATCPRNKAEVEVAEGTWRHTENRTSGTVTVRRDAALGVYNTGYPLNCPVVLDDGACISLTAGVPLVKGSLTLGGTVRVTGLSDTAAVGDKVMIGSDKSATAEMAKHFVVDGNRFSVALKGTDYVLAEPLKPSVDIVLPEAGGTAAPGSALEALLQTTVASLPPEVTRLTVAAEQKGQPMSAEAISAALEVFDNIAVTEVNGTEATLTVAYEFGVTAMTVRDGRLVLTAAVRRPQPQGAAVPAAALPAPAFARGVRVKLVDAQADSGAAALPEADPAGASEAELSVPLGASGLFRVRAEKTE